MGQYYIPLLSDGTNRKNFTEGICAWAYSHDFGQGLKLMEHSYIGNRFVGAITDRISETTGGLRVVWAGDYADEEPNGMTLYGVADELHFAPMQLPNRRIEPKPVRWLFSVDTHEYVDLSKCPRDLTGYAVHPLPLLTAEGNGRGGGDFMSGQGMEHIGRWARNRIMVGASDKDMDAPGWTELVPNFLEK